MKKKPNKKKYSLDEIADYMDRQELGEVSIDEIDTIGEFVDKKLNKGQEDE